MDDKTDDDKIHSNYNKFDYFNVKKSIEDSV